MIKKFKKFVGAADEFDEKDETQWAHCVIKPTDDDTLAVREPGLAAIAAQFSNNVSFVGPPGVGKSTLSSAIYNVQRNDRINYFETSDAMESWTRGIWALNGRTKAAKSGKDKVDVLDLEGIDDQDVIHYLVVIAMTLSKAVLLCADYRGAPRFKFTMFKTLESGVRIFKQNNIRVPKPVIYIQVPFGMTTFKLRNGEVDKQGLIANIKKKYKVLEEFEMRTFSLPSFKRNRFDGNYMKSVQSLVQEFEGIVEPKSGKAEDRVKYARIVAQALNSNSPSMISDLNLKFLQNQIKLITGTHESNARIVLRHKADRTLPLKKKISYEEFCRLVCPSGKFGYADGIKQEAKSLAYYDGENKKHEQALEEIDDEKHCLEVQIVIRDVYDKGLVELEQTLIAKGKEYMTLDSEYYRSFVKSEIQRHVNNIEFYGSTYLPHDLRASVDAKRHELKTKLLQNTQNMAKMPADYLSAEVLIKGWETEMKTLKATWDKRIRAAIGDRKVTTQGDHTCPSCSKSHSSTGVHHGGCKEGSLWYWVDPATKYCACDGGCGAVQQITSVCCAGCSTTLNAQIVPVN